MSSEDWDSYADTWTPRKTKRWIIIAIVFLVVMGPVAYGIKVAVSPVQGRGDQILRNQSEVNRTGKQEMFEDLYAHVKGYQVQITTQQAAAKANTDPADAARLNSVVTGLKNQCVSVVEQYNSETHKITSQDWKDDRLPYELSPAVCS